MITDAPYSAAASFLVTFSEVQAHRADAEEGGWAAVPFAEGGLTRTCDLKKLEGPQDLLGVGALEAGHYTQLRLVVSSAALYFGGPVDGVDPCASNVVQPDGGVSVEIPSGEVKLNRQFEVLDGGATQILLDFDGDRSVNETGNGRYRMTPVIGILSVQ